MNYKVRKVFLVILGVSAIPFAILLLTDCLVRTSSKN